MNKKTQFQIDTQNNPHKYNRISEITVILKHYKFNFYVILI